jgi:hypothetical protein
MIVKLQYGYTWQACTGESHAGKCLMINGGATDDGGAGDIDTVNKDDVRLTPESGRDPGPAARERLFPWFGCKEPVTGKAHEGAFRGSDRDAEMPRWRMGRTNKV